MATKDYFLKIEGIEGESQDPKHKGEIDVESFEWGESQTMAVEAGSGKAHKVKVQMQDARFTMFASRASTKFMTACAIGQEFDKATFTLRKAGGEQQEYLVFIFRDVFVSSYSIVGPATETSRPEKIGHEKNENSIPLERITLNFREIEVNYRGQKSSGELGGKNIFRFDLGLNRLK
jgi:type VI secretion system secreted protein Hcp